MTLTLKITFGTNVRIGTGSAADGLDETIDHSAPLTAGSLKGVMREEARWLLPGQEGQDHPFVQTVFGGPGGASSPWNFDVVPDVEPAYTNRASLRLDENGHVVDGALLIKEEASIASATVTIAPRCPVTSDGLPPGLEQQARECHLALLHLSARAAEKLGQRRTRGMGWQTITCKERRVKPDLSLVWQIREGGLK